MNLMQSEWDALILEQFQLKNNIDKVRTELTHALYQHDAACRVVARLIKERDLAKQDLARMRERYTSHQKSGNPSELPIEVVQDINRVQS